MTPDSQQQVKKRVRRIAGQVAGIERMIEEDRYCVDILLQVAAVRAALDGMGMAVGYPVATSDQAASFLHRGARLIATSETGILARSMSEFIGEVRTFND